MQQVIYYRRLLHEIPELDCFLPKTVSLVKEFLSPLRCEVFEPCTGAVVAYFDNSSKTTIAFRADLDALPITEATGLPFASSHIGCMHACGHDGHTAMLLHLAQLLDKDVSANNILLVFEPSEETGGGAKKIIDTGIFDRYKPSAIYAAHLWPNLACGKIGTRYGPLMAASHEIDVIVTGCGEHIAFATDKNDTALVAATFLKKATSLNNDTDKLIRFGKLSCGSVRNATGDTATLCGSLRGLSPTAIPELISQLNEISKEISSNTNCNIDIKINSGYPLMINNSAAVTAVIKASNKNYNIFDTPFYTTDDFSYFGEKIPSAYFMLGTGRASPLHSAAFDFDESTLLYGVKVLKQLADIILYPYNLSAN